MIRPSLSIVSALVALAASAGLSFWGGYSVRDSRAHREALQSLQEAREAEGRATEAILAAGERYEALRAEIENQRPRVERTVREIYRDTEVPTDCAAPAAARELLVSLGARGVPGPTAGAGGELPSAGDSASAAH